MQVCASGNVCICLSMCAYQPVCIIVCVLYLCTSLCFSVCVYVFRCQTIFMYLSVE